MTPQQLMDAMNLLDDDLIAETDALRRKAASGKPQWIRWLGVAACLGVVLAGLFTYRAATLPQDGETAIPTDAVSELPLDATAAGSIEGDTGAAYKSVTATILRWEEEGFTASVVTSDHHLLLPEKHLQVLFQDGAPFKPEEFPSGSTVVIYFTNLTENPQDNTCTVYAETIKLITKEEN